MKKYITYAKVFYMRLVGLPERYREHYVYPQRVKGKQKIFCVGRNKTGTTSLDYAFRDLGYIVSRERNQRTSKIWDAILDDNYHPLMEVCKMAQVFQDVPFSWPHTYRYLDKAYPDSKFILTVRDAESWYKSVVNHMAKSVCSGERIPTLEDLKKIKKGRVWMMRQKFFPDLPVTEPFPKKEMIKYYHAHNRDVIEYFKNNSDRLLVIDVSKKDDYIRFCNFLGVAVRSDSFPWKNKGTVKVAG